MQGYTKGEIPDYQISALLMAIYFQKMNREETFSLTEEMMNSGERLDLSNEMGKETLAVISNMDQPLGKAVGNALEVKEAIETLRGKGPEDLYELCLVLGSQMLLLAKVAKDEKEARKKLEQVIENGSALEKLKEFVKAQGGNP